jgi:hypothetical protein
MLSSNQFTSFGSTATPAASVYTPAEQRMQEIDALLAQLEQGAPLTDMASFVLTAFRQAQDHRRNIGVDQEMDKGLRAFNSKYGSESAELVGDDPNPIYMGITNLKARAMQAWVKDILANAEDKPWTMKATPMPELPPEAIEAVTDRLMQEVQKYGINTFDVKDRASVLKTTAYHHEQKLAGEAIERMERRCYDHLLEGGWREAFAAFTADMSIHPNAFIKGPVVTAKKALKWNGSELTAVVKQAYVVTRVSPYDVYPSPNSTTPQDGAYIIERQRLSQDQLLMSLNLPGFKEDAVRALVSSHPGGVALPNEVTQAQEVEEGKDQDVGAPEQLYNCIVYYGRVPARVLAAYGLGDTDFQGTQEAEVWVCGERVIRAILNPHPLGTRPFYTSSFCAVPGGFWGRSLPNLLDDVQRVANAAARALVRNMAFSSGPIGEYDINRLQNEKRIEELEPYRMYAVETDQFSATTQPAIKFTVVPSVARQLMQVYEMYSKLADEISGIPAYVMGSPQVAGAGRTLGGLAMLMGNAAKGIKAVIGDIDKRVVEPMVSNYYALLMMYDPDRSIKADASVVARGSAGILQRELSQARAVEVLQMLTPYAQAGLIPKEGLQLVLRDVLRGLGYSAEEIVPDPGRQAQLTSAFGDPMKADASTPATPVLDGRSAVGPDPGAIQLPSSG